MRALWNLLRNLAAALVALLWWLLRLVARPRPVEWVVYDLDGRFERGDPLKKPPEFPLRLPRGPRATSLARLRTELEHLRRVPSLRGVFVRLGSPHCGLPLLLELRAALEGFRGSGKRLIVGADALGLREYWLASAAEEIWLAPRGRLELVGFAAVARAAARPLRRFGIEAHVVKAGLFKAAGELFGADRVSDENARQIEELVGDLSELFVSDIARARGRTPAQVRAAIDQGPFTARAAKEAGLVDGLAYADEVREKLGADSPDGPRRARLGPFSAALATHPPAADWRPLADRRPVVAVVDLHGMIVHGRSRAPARGPATAGSETLVAALTRLRRDRSVRAVVLHIDSRGGSALASDLVWRAVRKLDERKPVVAFLDGVAASGGYYIAAGARRIVAAPACITGSIGVIAMRPDVSRALEKAEVDQVVVRRGAHATVYRADVALSAEEEAALQRDIRETYGDFVAVVAAGRSLPEEEVRRLAEGRVYLATRAKDLKLLDALGTLEDAVEEARGLAHLPARPRLLPVRPPRTGLLALLREWRRGTGLLSLLVPDLGRERVLALWIGPEIDA